MGVELSVADFACKDPSSLLPSYMREVGMMAGADIVELDDSDMGDAGSDVSFNMRDTHALPHDQCQDGEDMDSVRLADGPERPMEAPACSRRTRAEVGPQADVDCVLSDCLTIPGLQHIVNNLCNDVHNSMGYFATFWQHLKSLESLLCVSERRGRYVWTCLRGTDLEYKDAGHVWTVTGI